MKLISLNISEIKQVQYRGKTLSTGIFKQATKDEVFVSKNNIEGDLQADLKYHGGQYKAVYGFSADHYDYWREALSNPELQYGMFGENLTLSALDESILCIGDQLSIGSCILQISQPRVPCFKLGIILNNNKAPNLFTKSWSTGVYFEVIKEGRIKPGDAARVTTKALNSVTVQALFRAYYDKDFDGRKVLETALTLAALAPEWRDKIVKKLSQSCD